MSISCTVPPFRRGKQLLCLGRSGGRREGCWQEGHSPLLCHLVSRHSTLNTLSLRTPTSSSPWTSTASPSSSTSCSGLARISPMTAISSSTTFCSGALFCKLDIFRFWWKIMNCDLAEICGRFCDCILFLWQGICVCRLRLRWAGRFQTHLMTLEKDITVEQMKDL